MTRTRTFVPLEMSNYQSVLAVKHVRVDSTNEEANPLTLLVFNAFGDEFMLEGGQHGYVWKFHNSNVPIPGKQGCYRRVFNLYA